MSDKRYRVMVFSKTDSFTIIKGSGELRPHEIPFYLDNDIDLEKEDFDVVESKTHEYVEVVDEFSRSWKHKPE